ncbi:MAG: MerR family transcriptional regulator [Chloroflexota bacterium]
MFLAGEFSKISQVSKRLLHYYDEIGLLKPAQIDPNTGYRYYSARQLPHLNRILALKELGLTLDQIARMMADDISDAEIHGMLLMKKAEVEQALMDDLQRLRRIEARIQRNQASERNEDLPEVVMKSVPAQQFLSTRTIFPDATQAQQLIIQMHQVLPKRLGTRALGSMAAVLHSEEFGLENTDIEIGFLLKKSLAKTENPIVLSTGLDHDYALQVRELPAVETMATTVAVGDPTLVFLAFGVLGNWIEANGYRIAGPYREVSLAFPTTPSFEDTVVEVQLPVEKRVEDFPLQL